MTRQQQAAAIINHSSNVEKDDLGDKAYSTAE
jgi:hypothetical protein